MAFVNEKDEHGLWRTADHERGVVLKCDGGGGSQPEKEFVLLWKKHLIRILCQFSFVRFPDNSDGVDWQILVIIIPNLLKRDTEKIKIIIKEALEVHGFAHNREIYSQIKVGDAQRVLYYDDKPQQQVQL